MLAYAEKHLPDSDAALKLLIAKHHDTAALQIARVCAYRQERDRAFEWLDAAFRQHDSGLAVILTDPLLASLRSDPRYRRHPRAHAPAGPIHAGWAVVGQSSRTVEPPAPDRGGESRAKAGDLERRGTAIGRHQRRRRCHFRP